MSLFRDYCQSIKKYENIKLIFLFTVLVLVVFCILFVLSCILSSESHVETS